MGGGKQSQWQGNIIKAQQYLYEDTDTPFVIVGTSLSARIYKVLLSDEYYNLAFDGGSLFTGLQIILKGDKHPRAVLIEINFIEAGENSKFVDSMFVPFVYSLRSYIPALREQYQPAVITMPQVDRLYQLIKSGVSTNQVQRGEQKSINKGEGRQKSNILDVWLPMKQKEFSRLPNATVLEWRLKQLENIVHALKTRGIRVIFFEMPLHPTLKDTPKAGVIRERILERFPADYYAWIPMPDPNEFESSDGTHLAPTSAKKYAAYLQAQVRAIVNPEKSL